MIGQPTVELRLLSREEWDDLDLRVAEHHATPLMTRSEADAFLARTPSGARWVADIDRSRTAAARRTAGTGQPSAPSSRSGGALTTDQAA